MWLEYIPNYKSFAYEFIIPIDVESFKEKIVGFNLSFLRLGKKYDVFLDSSVKINYEQFVERLLDYQERCYRRNRQGYLKLLDSSTWNTDGKLTKPSFSSFVGLYPRTRRTLSKAGYDVLDIEYPSAAELFDFTGDYYWFSELNIIISSHSNLWFELIDKVGYSEKVGYDFVDRPLLNVDSYYATPRFNSFLRDLTNELLTLGGEVRLLPDHHNNVTSKGVLTSGEIIYYEDAEANQ